jgi:endo-1,3-beta-xylanase
MPSRPVAWAWVALSGFGMLGCSSESLLPPESTPPPVPPLSEPLGSDIAEPGRVRLFVGQDVESIAAYARDVAPVTGAVSYTSLQRLEGVTEAQDSGGGPMFLDGLAADHPGVPLALGLYLVDDLPHVLAGERDAALAQLAERLAGYDVPVLVRIGYEFDIDWAHYRSDDYRRAFVKIGRALRDGAPNVQLVWHSAATCNVSLRAREAYYPGDEYVDYVAASFFSQSACAFQPLLDLVGFARQHQKPFFIAESTPQGFDLGDGTFSESGTARDPVTPSASYQRWFEPFFAFIHQHTDVVRGVSYIDSDWDTQRQWGPPYAHGYFGDSRVQADPEIKARWLGELSDSLWVTAP